MIALIRTITFVNNGGNAYITYSIVLIGVMSMVFGQLSNFFIFYNFNKNFQNILKKNIRTNESIW
jgi:hypothetical protein